MINKLKCLIFGHQRGKRAPEYETTLPDGAPVSAPSVRAYRCPRCSATWTRKVKAAA